MPSRLAAEWIAIALLLMIGIPGVMVGASLAPAIRGGGLFLVVGLVGYGVAALVAAAGMIGDRRWGRLVGIGTVLAGLAVLGYVHAMTGWRDPVIWGGVAIWVVALAVLLAAKPPPGR